MTPGSPVRVQSVEDGAIWRVTLATPKANLLDMEKIEALTKIFNDAARTRDLKAIVIDGDGPSFCYGASVEEHLPGSCERMIPAFSRLFLSILDSNVTCVAAVRGQCLGGGMELAAFCHRVVVSPEARMGQPEILLGVIAPVASVILPARVGQAMAEDLLLTGRVVSSDEALSIGLADEIAEDPSAAALHWLTGHLVPKSASSLRLALRAARSGYAGRMRADLPEIERIYLGDLMQTADAAEGLSAFMEKRPPVWRNR